MVEGLAEELFRRHVRGGPGIARGFLRLVGPGLGEVKIDQFDVGISRHQKIFRFKVEVHVSGIVDVIQSSCGIDQDIAEIVLEEVVTAGEDQFEVGGFDILHGEKGCAFDTSMIQVTNDEIMALEFLEDLAAVEEAGAFGEVENRGVDEAADGDRTAVGGAGEPDFGETAAIDEFFEPVRAKFLGTGVDRIRVPCLHIRHDPRGH